MSTERLNAIASDTIDDVVFEKGKVVICIDSKRYTISQESYLSGYFYPGKVLSSEEMKTLTESSRLVKANDYLHRLLSQGRYTEKMAATKLRTHFPNLRQSEIHTLLKPYLDSHVIDDKSYVVDFIQAKQEQGYGKAYLVQSMKQFGVPQKILDSSDVQALLNTEDSNDPMLLSLIGRLDRHYAGQPLEKRKAAIQAGLSRRGYSLAVIQEAIRSHFDGYSKDQWEEDRIRQDKSLKDEMTKCYNSLKSRPVDDSKKRQLLIDRLLRKGYSYAAISTLLTKERYFQHD